MKEVIEFKVIQLIGLFDYLLSIENFSVYAKIREMYKELLKTLESKKNIQAIEETDFDIVQNAFRLIYEAPPKDSVLGLYILNKMQEIYDLKKKL